MVVSSLQQGPLAPGAVGIFGGSFDPAHLAHLALARTARDQLGLRELRWVPAGQPWQKQGRAITAAAQRCEMIERLISGEPGFALDRSEIERAGPSYTVETLERLGARPDTAAHWVLVIGQDQYARLTSWHRWRELLQLCCLAVAARAGEVVHATPELEAVAHTVVRLDMPAMEISSTLVRETLTRGEDITPLVGDGVARYIAQHRLYSEY